MTKHKYLMNLSIFSMALLVLNSCGLPYSRNITFDDEDLLWVPSYDLGDSLFFFCNETSSTDTIIVTEALVDDALNRHWYSISDVNWMEGSNDYNAMARFRFEVKHNNGEYKGVYQLFKHNPVESAMAFSILFDQYSKREISIQQTQSLSIDGTEYHECIVQREFNVNDSSVLMQSLVWNRAVGLLQYTVIGEGSYNFVERRPQNSGK